MCIPHVEGLRRELLNDFPNSKFTVHPKGTKIYSDMKQLDWWSKLKRDIAEFITQCLVCQQVKVEHQQVKVKHQQLRGKLQPLYIFEWKYENITKDFVLGLPKSLRGNDAVWVIVDGLTMSTHLLPIRTTFTMDKLAFLYVKKVVRPHEISCPKTHH